MVATSGYPHLRKSGLVPEPARALSGYREMSPGLVDCSS
jgi:hypothetical protein